MFLPSLKHGLVLGLAYSSLRLAHRGSQPIGPLRLTKQAAVGVGGIVGLPQLTAY